jgi:hypothetical protein
MDYQESGLSLHSFKLILDYVQNEPVDKVVL